MNVQDLWTDTRGAVAVEFVFISIALLFFITFLSDLLLRQAMTGKLDRVSYSVAGVLRERTQLYDDRETLSQQDVDEAANLAKRMLSDMAPDANLNELTLYVEELHFNDVEPDQNIKKVNHYQSRNSGLLQCTSPQSLRELANLSPRGSYGRWVPLYQVTVCLPTIGWFKRLTATEEKPVISSFAIVMLR